jgi:hypothetical protein
MRNEFPEVPTLAGVVDPVEGALMRARSGLKPVFYTNGCALLATQGSLSAPFQHREICVPRRSA